MVSCKSKRTKNLARRTTSIAFLLVFLIMATTAVLAGTVTWDEVPPPTINCTQGQQCLWDFNATSSESLPLNYSLDKPPFSQNIDASTGILNFTPENSDVKSYDVFAIAAELGGSGYDIARINWTVINVNDPPNITAYYPENRTNLTTKESTLMQFNVTATDPDLTHGDYLNYTWMVDGKVNRTLLDYSGNEANYTPGFLSAGVHEIRVNVTDSENVTDSVNWTINVTNQNRLCYQNDTIPNVTMQEDQPAYKNFSLYDYFTDPDIDDYPLNFTPINNTNVTIEINKTDNNTVSFIPDLNFFGLDKAQFRCWDGYNHSNWSNEMTINVTAVQDPPNVTQVADKIAYVDALFTLEIEASDVDGDTLTYYDNTSLFDIEPNTGVINFTPAIGDIDNYTINISVSDSFVNSSIVFNMSVVNNSAPVLSPIGDRTATEGSQFTLQINATDADVIESVTFDYICNNCSGTVDASIFEVTTTNSSPENATGQIQFTPTNSDVGDWSVTYYANDTREASDSETITFSIENIDFDPILDPIPDYLLKVDTPFNTTVTATDEDGDIDGFTDNTTLFDIDNTTTGENATGTIEFTPNTIGNYSVNITVIDSTGGLDWQQVWFNVTENRPPVLDPIPNQTATEDFAFSVQVNATDPDPQDQDNLDYYDNTSLFNITSSGMISFTPNASQIGNYTVNITVSDGEYNDSRVTNFTVLFYDDYPYWDPSLTKYYVNESNYINNTYWNSSDFNLSISNMTLWNISIWQSNRTVIYMDAYDEESTVLSFNVTYINYTNASNDTAISGIELFSITNYDDDTALVDFTPDNSDVGRYSVNFTVNDDTGRSTSTIIDDLVVYNVNDAPIVTNYSPETNQSMTENTSRMFEVDATDIDYGDSIKYRWYYEGSKISGATDKNYTFYAGFDTEGNRTLRVEIYDEANLTTSKTWNLNITNLNREGWFGKIITKTADEFNEGNFVNTTAVQTGRYTAKLELGQLGVQYRPSGTYESSIGDAEESNYFHNFTTINWTGNYSLNNSNISFEVWFQTRTDQALNGGCAATMDTNYSDPIYTSGGNITSPQEPCIQYKAMIKTNDTDHTPTIEKVEINYEIGDYEQEQSTTRNWVYLRDYFEDPDSDDELRYNVTNADGTAIDTSQANITISNSTSRVTVTSNKDFKGEMEVMFHMTDGEYNVSSNPIKLTITEIPPIQNPIIIPVGGGGGAAVPQPVEVEVPRYIATPVAFRLLAPMKVSTYGNDTIEVPINLFNQGNFTLEDIEIEAETDNEYVDLRLSRTRVAVMEPGKREFLTLTAESYRTYGDYEILLTAKGDAVTTTEQGREIRSTFNERTKIFVSSLLKAEGNETAVETKLAFAQDLLTSNPECLELNEFIGKAQELIEEGEETEAAVLLDKVVESCKFLVAPKEKMAVEEEPEKMVRFPKESIYLLATVAVLTLIIAIALVIGWAHMRRRVKEFKGEL